MEQTNTHTTQLQLYRLLLLITAVAYTLFGYIDTYVLEHPIETPIFLIQRVVLGLVFLFVVLLSYPINLIRQNMYAAIGMAACVGMGHLYIIGYYNSFASDHLFGVLFTFIATCFVFKHQTHLFSYLIYNLAFLIITISLIDESMVSKPIVVAVFSCAAIVLFLMINTRLKIEKQLIESKNAVHQLLEQEKIINQQLNEQKEELKKAQQIAKLGSFRLHLKNYSADCSAEFLSIFEIDKPAGTYPWVYIVDRIYPEDRNAVTLVLDTIKKQNSTTDENGETSFKKYRRFTIEYKIKVQHPAGKHIISYIDAFFSHEHIEIIGIVQDVSELKLAQLKIQEQEKKYKDMVMLAREGIWEVDAQGKTLFTNRKMLDMFQYTAEEAKELNFFDFIHSHAPYELMKAVTERKKFPTRINDFSFTNKRGEIFWIILSTALNTNERGQIISAIVVMTDITERKENERLVRAKDLAEHKIKVKDDFFSSMSHELRTPLNSMSMNIQLLMMQKKGMLNESQIRYLSAIDKSSAHLLNLVNDLLDISKIQAGKFKLYKTTVPLSRLCADSIEFIKPQAKLKKIKIWLEIDPQFPNIYGDERRLKQILINLLSNAVKFTPENGNIGIMVKGKKSENQLSICVWDDGIGISADNQQKLFDPYAQIKSDEFENIEGTGLGLTLVQQLTELHNGHLSLSSEEHKGTTITINFPLIHSIPNLS